MENLVVGYFGYHTGKLNGQTVKTRDLYALLQQNAGNVEVYDTEDLRYSKLSIFRLLWNVCRARNIYYLPAQNNLKYFLPVIFLLSKLFRSRLMYFVIGGWLVEMLEGLPLHRRMLKHIDAIFPETELMCRMLESNYGISNAEVFPNFRITDYVPGDSPSAGKLRLVFMARIHRLKGLETIFSFAGYAKDKGLDVEIDFYGPVNEADKEYFGNMVEKTEQTSYKGELQPSDIHAVLSGYDLMLLPTQYYTEGFPGSVLDAYISGIPVVVTEWKHAAEFVSDGVTGYIVPFVDGQDMFNKRIEELYNNRALLQGMKKEALKRSWRYKPSSAMEIIKRHLG